MIEGCCEVEGNPGKPFKVALVTHEGLAVPPWIHERLAAEGIRFVVHECETRDELIAHAHDADLVWVRSGSRVITKECLPLLESCGAIVRTGSGTDNIPVESATKLGIIVANTPHALADAVAEHAIGLLASLVRMIPWHDRNVRRGNWDNRSAWPRWHLRNSTLGLIGFGMIPRRVVKMLAGFEMRFLVHDPYVSDVVIAEHGAHSIALDDLLGQSDFVSLHIPSLPATRHFIGEAQLHKMKPNAILINTARGALVDESALTRALLEGWIAGAALDVTEQEPLGGDSELLKMDNVVVTPHIGAYDDLFVENTWRGSVETILDLYHHRWPRSCVNPHVRSRWEISRPS